MQEGVVPFVVDAVYAMAHALHNMRTAVCADPSYELCDAMNPPAGPELLRFIRNVSFIGQWSGPLKVSFILVLATVFFCIFVLRNHPRTL